MEILGIGASEILFILIIAIIILGPKDMQKAGRTIGRWLNQLVRSDGWKAFQRASQEIKRLPTNLMREANLDAEKLRELDREIRGSIDPRQPPSASGSASDQKSVLSESVDPSLEPPATPPADVSNDKEQND